MSRASMPIMPFFVDRYIAGTRHMTLAERGAYTDLLFAQWTRGPLPNDTRRLATLISCEHKQFLAVWATIKIKFRETSAGLVNDVLEGHREKTRRLIERKRLGANKTNRKRWGAGSLSESLSDSESESQGASHPYPYPDIQMLTKGKGYPEEPERDRIRRAVE
jgi:uncharacterized protein YdaU (DUF1376 family)